MRLASCRPLANCNTPCLVWSTHPTPATLLEAGRTSSIGQHTLCLDSKGQVLNDASFRCGHCHGTP